MKWLFTILWIVLAAFSWLLTVTVPMTQALVPCILALFFTFLAWFFWPGRRDDASAKRYHDKPYADSDDDLDKTPDAN